MLESLLSLLPFTVLAAPTKVFIPSSPLLASLAAWLCSLAGLRVSSWRSFSRERPIMPDRDLPHALDQPVLDPW